MILRLPWALPATQCWSTTSPSAAATLVWQSASSSPSQSPSRDIRCKEINCTTWTRTWNRWKETKMNKATFLAPKDYLRIITKKPLLLTSLTQKDLIFKSNTRKNTIGFEKKKIENLTKEIRRIILYLNLLKGVLWNLFKSLCFCQYLPMKCILRHAG